MTPEETFEIIKTEMVKATEGFIGDPVTPAGKEELMGVIRRMHDRTVLSLGLPQRFSVKCDEENNPPESIEQGIVNATITLYHD